MGTVAREDKRDMTVLVGSTCLFGLPADPVAESAAVSAHSASLPDFCTPPVCVPARSAGPAVSPPPL